MVYLFNNFQIDTVNFTLKCDDNYIEIEPLVFNLIVYLIENKSKLVSRDELLKNVWQGRIVLDATLNNHIKAARKALDDDGQSQKVIRTIHGRGYQFVAEIETSTDISDISTKTSSMRKYIPTLLLLVIVSIILFLISKNLIPESRIVIKKHIWDIYNEQFNVEENN